MAKKYELGDGPPPYQIATSLSFGGVTEMRQAVKAGAVDSVLTVCDDRKIEIKDEKIDHFSIPFPDKPPFNVRLIDTCVEWIYSHIEAGATVFVHCSEGNSRSPHVAMAYLMKYSEFNARAAAARVAAVKPWVTMRGKVTKEEQKARTSWLFLKKYEEHLAALSKKKRWRG